MDYDLGPLLETVKRIPQDAWTFRGDPESYKTKTVRESSPVFPKALVESLLSKAIDQYLPPGYTNRVVLSNVPAGEEILPHTDDFGHEVRSKSYHCHIPLTSPEGAVMGFPDRDEEVHMKRGVLYCLNETEPHYVKNKTKEDRIHLLFAVFPHKGKCDA